MLESTFLEDWDAIGIKMAKKGHLLHKSGFNSELVSIQRVKTAISQFKTASESSFVEAIKEFDKFR